MSTKPSFQAMQTDLMNRIIRYHVQTKHHFNRYARSQGFLDWANQPDPFRRFEGAELISFPLLKPEEEPHSPDYEAMYEQRTVLCQPISLSTLSRFFEFALALSAWKKAGESEWALRMNPSSGNLHPTEGYVVLPEIDGLGLKPGLYHYAPKEHGLELRAEFPAESVARLLAPFPSGAVLFGLTSVHWREAWKYGERAFRYCNHDVGHAIGSTRVAAATLGWNMALLDGMDQHAVAQLLGTGRKEDYGEAEQEHPDCLAVMWPSRKVRGEQRTVPLFLDSVIVKELSGATWHGKANRLSGEHGVQWDIIDEAAEASWKHSSAQDLVAFSQPPQNKNVPLTSHAGPLAGQIIRQRRSAVAFDGQTSISAATFFHMMQRVMPRADQPQLERPMPWDVWPYDPAIHLVIFVHRVDGLSPGLYVLARDTKKLAFLQQAMNSELAWTIAPGSPEDLPLYWLLEGDARKTAVQVSCHQDIAGDSAFSLGMLAEFEGTLRERGAWWYPRMFWEAGLLGQVLYLEAEAAGVRATGIGCFFDDPVHEIVGVTNVTLQSLYHFTIGGPVEDRRMQTLLPYHHLPRHS
ncbi:MAG: SagB/ThcOx family dehydrogenase [Nitrospira sp.]|nr:SagB/ThcOx family dehydrogenase [Nitrospira sp.]MDH4369126.1 SagB/ThcOx family dehydrogenase [Nitrospira sp.]MDH5497063.1 SagB/ThcOx family dehydrogenase [Nitrospira sp.]MDH5727019.1 SagB/ThcOx family dehydrogenase [Nitrospira sp.]